MSPLAPLLPEAADPGTDAAEAIEAEVELARDGTKTRIRIWQAGAEDCLIFRGRTKRGDEDESGYLGCSKVGGELIGMVVGLVVV